MDTICSDGTIWNSKTKRCVKENGRTAKKLATNAMRQSATRMRGQIGEVQQQKAYTRNCPPGWIRSEITGHCIKVGGPTLKKLIKEIEREDQAHSPRRIEVPLFLKRGSSPVPSLLHVNTRLGTIQPMAYATQKAEVVPLGNKEDMVQWIKQSCALIQEPISGIPFARMTAANLMTVIRTSAGTCIRGELLQKILRNSRERGNYGVDPVKTNQVLQRTDLDAIRVAVRRLDPEYITPARVRGTRSVHSSSYIPQNWSIAVYHDTRSGPDFMSVYIYDRKKSELTPNGRVIPKEAIVIDVGLFPSSIVLSDGSSKICSTASVLTALQNLFKSHKLLIRDNSDPLGWSSRVLLPIERSKWRTDTGAIDINKFKYLCTKINSML